MSAGLRVRSCRFMPPEDYEGFGDRKASPICAVGARSYAGISRKFMKLSGASNVSRNLGPLASLKSFLNRLGFLG